MSMTRALIVVVVLGVWAAVADAATITIASKGCNIVATASTRGSSWKFKQATPHWYHSNVRTKFHNAPFLPFMTGPLTSKANAGTNSSPSPTIDDPDGSGAFGQAVATVVSTGGNLYFSYTWQLDTIASSPVPIHKTETKARYVDPTPLEIGDSTTQLGYSLDLHASTQVQSVTSDPLNPPTLLLEARFGIGTFDNEDGTPLPDLFWDQPPPAGAFDLYRIAIFENTLGDIEASVDLFASPDPDFEVAFSRTEAQIKSDIETAGWVNSGGTWMLPQDLSLVELSMTNLDSANVGEAAAIGAMTTGEAVLLGADIIPTVSEWGLIVMTLLALTAGTIVFARRRRPASLEL